jgi:hypothetical protein
MMKLDIMPIGNLEVTSIHVLLQLTQIESLSTVGSKLTQVIASH